MAPERKLYQKLKSKTPKIIWNRLENLSLSGTPDLLGYNTSGHFFTVELKVCKGNKIRFSPHQIAFHIKHPKFYTELRKRNKSDQAISKPDNREVVDSVRPGPGHKQRDSQVVNQVKLSSQSQASSSKLQASSNTKPEPSSGSEDI